MRVVTGLPYQVREDQHVWIEMTDGVRLAARIWRPVSADEDPVPAVLELIPYRQRDLTAQRDSIHHPYVAGHGYACVRVDLRGSGNSEGVLTDEYLPQELDDAETILAWLADQPWCDGRTGMMGISWGGFNALQVAARRPPSLGAIVTVCSTDDRYSDDVHYMGGCLLSDNLSWASTMFAYNSCPPDPAVVGERWRELWLERLGGSGLWLDTWLRHQTRDEFWQHGSVCEDYADVQVPVMAVSGWADGYSNAVFRMLEHLDVPRMGLIGPWSHKYPHLGQPGPAVGFLQETVHWWDRWLKNREPEVPDPPMLRVFMQDSVPPHTSYQERLGRWVGEPSWPSPHVREERRSLAQHRIVGPDEAGGGVLAVESPLSVGQFAGKWCSYNAPPDLPYDQREEDGGSLVFETEPLAEPLEILGAPSVELDLSASAPTAMVAVRLSDVSPDGAATRVTYGLLNLTHRDGHNRAVPVEPGKRYQVTAVMNGVAHAFAAGHKVRLSVSTSYWPLAWPPPEPVRLEIHTRSSAITLPVRPVDEPDEVGVRAFDEPEGAPPIQVTQVTPEEHAWRVTRDLVDYRMGLEVLKDLGVVRFDDIDLQVRRRAHEVYSSRADDFVSPRGETDWTMEFRRGDWLARSESRTILECTKTDFVVHAQLDAYEGERRVCSLNWSTTVPRDGV
ncbi:MAG: CocE/NonD family hydrolase [Actinomycetota bacterium]|nr:CocE/NonD family hydrolase [Actinomycetota bacterium]